MTSATETAPTSDLTLSPSEQAILSAEIGPFAATLGDVRLRERYALVAAAVTTGHLPGELVGLVEALAELLLQTQRIRRQHGPEAERALAGLYERTPGGRARRQAAGEVNTALAALQGQPLLGLTFSPTPGGQRLSITTPQGQLEVMIDRAGVRLERVELGRVG